MSLESRPKSKRQKKLAKNRIQILNPVAGVGHIALSQARRHVREGRAVILDGKLRFLESHKHNLFAAQSASAQLIRAGEGPGMATLKAVQGLPVAGQAIRVFTGTRTGKPIVDLPTIRISVHSSEPLSF